MEDKHSWDWDTGLKEIPIKEWQNNFVWVEEPYVSPDGETVASIVNLDQSEFSICENGKIWEQTYEKAWCLRPLPEGKFAVCVSKDEEWTVSVGQSEWETWFDYIWNLSFTKQGNFIGALAQKDMEYGVAVNDKVWNNMYENISGLALHNKGRTAAVVQVSSLASADIEGFKQGIFSCAIDGVPCKEKYLNIWDISFSSDADQVAYAVRLNREEYSIVQNNKLWNKTFETVWSPKFLNDNQSVLAPVRENEKWTLYKDALPFWDNKYDQLWNIKITKDNNKIAAIVSDSFGKWSVAENDRVWNVKFDTMISDLFYSEDGSTLVALVKNKGFWSLAVNQKVWDIRADKIWDPVISADGKIISIVAEKQGQFFLIVNNKIVSDGFNWMFSPEISPDNDKIMQKSIKNGVYQRKIISLNDL